MIKKIGTYSFSAFLIMGGLPGCSTFPAWLPSSGPSVAHVVDQDEIDSPIPVVEVSDVVARRVLAAQRTDSFAEVLSAKAPPGYVVGAGDVLEVSVWEAPPAALFGVAVVDQRAGLTSTRQTTFPEQIVNTDGVINVPFAGTVPVAGKTPQQIEADLVQRLKGKANQPQVLVRVIRNATANVTVVGEVAASTRMPLTAKGERLLDAVAAAGGVRQPVGKITLQLSRGGKVIAMPLDSVIQDPKQNVYLQPGDVVTALFQPLSFTALGATGRNEEVNFEAQGITLALDVASSCFARLKDRRRSLAGRTGCGLCGTDSLAQAVRSPTPLTTMQCFEAAAVSRALARMRERQLLLGVTGASHAAAWCTADGEITLLREDVGRHNALDKLLGAAARAHLPVCDGFIAVTSRASYEMVQKTASAGVSLLAAVSGVTGLAIDTAQGCGVTLLGFARGQDLSVYSHADRIHLEVRNLEQ